MAASSSAEVYGPPAVLIHVARVATLFALPTPAPPPLNATAKKNINEIVGVGATR